MYSILAAYLVLPALSAIHRSVSLPNKLFMLTGWVLVASLAPAIGNWTAGALGLDPTFFPLYAGYMVLGASLRRINPTLGLGGLGAFAAILGWAVTYWMTIVHSHIIQRPSDLFYQYWSPNVLLLGVGLFLLLRSLHNSLAPLGPLLQYGAKLSFGIISAPHFHPARALLAVARGCARASDLGSRAMCGSGCGFSHPGGGDPEGPVSAGHMSGLEEEGATGPHDARVISYSAE